MTSTFKPQTAFSALHIPEPDRAESEDIDESDRATIAACTIAGWMPWLPLTTPPHGAGVEVPTRITTRYFSSGRRNSW
jgi:hypothetical protein